MEPEALAAPALTALLSGEPGRAWPYAVESQSIAFENLNPQALSPGRERMLQEAWQGLASGQLQIGVDPVSGAELSMPSDRQAWAGRLAGTAGRTRGWAGFRSLPVELRAAPQLHRSLTRAIMSVTSLEHPDIRI